MSWTLALCYHRVLPTPPSADAGSVNAFHVQRNILLGLDDFLAQLDALLDRYEVLDAATFVRRLDAGQKGARPSVMLTFDDGYADFAEFIVPALEARGLPCVLFASMAPIQSGFVTPSDRVYAALTHDARAANPVLSGLQRESWVSGDRKHELLTVGPEAQDRIIAKLEAEVGVAEPPIVPRHMSEEQLRRLPDSVVIGAHGMFHHEFASLPKQRLQDELKATLQWVRCLRPHQSLGNWLAYPNGKSDRGAGTLVRNAAVEAGVDLAFLADTKALSSTGSERLSIPRRFVSSGLEWIDSLGE
jgi:peptidoglycan/xylan/chitin deacetylase (PgdA/CDA1 family)